MKKVFIVIAAAVFYSSPSLAEWYPNCDFGAKWEKEDLIDIVEEYFILAPFVTTTALPMDFTTYVSSKISGFSGCERLAFIKLQQHRFAYVAKDNLVIDMANGGGEFVTTMAYLQGCPAMSYNHYAKLTQHKFVDIFPLPDIDSSQLLSNLEYQIEQDPMLSGSCKWAS